MNSTLENNPFTLLPLDVLGHIVSFLSQSDCLECSHVSRSFYQLLPLFTHKAWEHLNLTHIPSPNMRRFLGPHVKSINLKVSECFSGNNANRFYRSIFACDLRGVQKLAIANRSRYAVRPTTHFLTNFGANAVIRDLDLLGYVFDTDDKMGIARLLKCYADHLTTVKLRLSDTFLFPTFPTTLVSQMPKLTNLALLTRIDPVELDRLLSACPNLMTLDIRAFEEGAGACVFGPDGIRRLWHEAVFARCPKLTSLGYHNGIDWRWCSEETSAASERHPGVLSHLSIESSTPSDFDHLLPLLDRFANQITSLAISGQLGNQPRQAFVWSTLRTSVFPCLGRVQLRGLHLDLKDTSEFLRRHDTLWGIDLNNLTFDYTDDDFDGAESYDPYQDYYDDEEFEMWSGSDAEEKEADFVRQRERARGPTMGRLIYTIEEARPLRELSIGELEFCLDDSELPRMLRPHVQSLEILRLVDVKEYDLSIIGDMHQLRVLALNDVDKKRDEIKEILKGLATNAKQLEELTLCIDKRTSLDDQSLAWIGQMKSLRRLQIVNASGWSSYGMIRLARSLAKRIDMFTLVRGNVRHLTPEVIDIVGRIVGMEHFKCIR